MSNKTKQNTFSYLLLLTCFLVLIEISFFVLCNKAYLSDFTFVSSHIKIPTIILPDILFFLAAQAGVHLLFCLITWFAATFTGYLLRLSSDNSFLLAVGLWLTGIGCAFAANQFYFPNSKFTELTSLVLFTHTSAGAIAFILSILYGTALVAGMTGFLIWLSKKSFRAALCFSLSLSTAAWIGLNHSTPAQQYSNQASPNVIIVGIDSLRPDFLSYFGAEHSTPFIDAFLQQSSIFTEAVTPLARTFPSWSSVLLGQHPHESGIRFNLADTSHTDLSRSLPAIFKQHGYTTIYATDETRFSNIDHPFGFDKVITPPMGLNDFLLGTFNDFPLTNLIINTRVGRWLFPYSYANRPVFATYDPDSFIGLMRPAILQPHSQPVFMAVHFCLPHYPYLWAGLPGNQFTPQERYRESVVRADQQIKSFFALLTEAKLLDKAIVVLLSDHGEALEFSGDRITQADSYLGKLNKAGEPPHFYPPSLDNEAVNQSAGHGTDVLGLPQYHSLLAFKFYGLGKQHSGEITGVVPLTEIKQTILTLAGFSKHPSVLADSILHNIQRLPIRHVFLESDYSPAAMRTVYPETRDVMLEGIQLFQINSATARLTVKPEMGEMIIRSKQIADIYDNWMLALYPQETKSFTPVLINLKTGQWTNDLHSRFAQQSPAEKMLAAMRKFYDAENKLVIEKYSG